MVFRYVLRQALQLLNQKVNFKVKSRQSIIMDYVLSQKCLEVNFKVKARQSIIMDFVLSQKCLEVTFYSISEHSLPL